MTIAVRGDAETVQKGLPSGKGASFFLCLTTAFPAIRLSLCRGQPLEDFNQEHKLLRMAHPRRPIQSIHVAPGSLTLQGHK
jgi:hypothetical protein